MKKKVVLFPGNPRPVVTRNEPGRIIIMPIVRVERAPVLPTTKPTKNKRRGSL